MPGPPGKVSGGSALSMVPVDCIVVKPGESLIDGDASAPPASAAG